MEKGIKKIFCLILMFLTIVLNAPKLDAATGTISVKSNKTTAVIGSTVRVTVTISSSETLGAWDITLSYDSSKLKLANGQRAQKVESNESGTGKTKTYTFDLIVLAKGTSTVTVKSAKVLPLNDANDTPLTLSIGSTKITGITQAELEASYSKNNNLSSLGVDGYNLNETFNKESIEYTVTVPSDVEKINITGSVEDSKASVTGLGEKEVSEGENKFDIVVTAENGSQKTYTLKVNVQDDNPIEVVIDGLTYTVVKRGSTLTAPATFEESTQRINDIEVPAFKSNITGFTLVGLKNTNGETNLYIYNEEKNTYTLYKELKTEGILLFPTTAKVAPEYYKKTKITINGEELEAFQYDGVDDYYLIYGINIETGSEGFYQYDMVNNTITRYNDKIINELTKRNENFLMIIIVLGVETIVMIFILLITLIKKNKKPKTKKQSFKDFEKELEEPKKESKIKTKKEEPKVEEKNETKESKEENKKDKKRK